MNSLTRKRGANVSNGSLYNPASSHILQWNTLCQINKVSSCAQNVRALIDRHLIQDRRESSHHVLKRQESNGLNLRLSKCVETEVFLIERL